MRVFARNFLYDSKHAPLIYADNYEIDKILISNQNVFAVAIKIILSENAARFSNTLPIILDLIECGGVANA